MSQSPLDRIPAFNRVSIRAVLVHPGKDSGPALSEAGILDPIAIPVVLGEDVDLPGGILGDGITPNLRAVLETEHQDDFDASPTNQTQRANLRPDVARPAEPVTTMLPAAFGLQPMAPVRRLDASGQQLGTGAGRFGNRASGDPPSPVWPSRADPTGTSGGRDLNVYATNNSTQFANPSRNESATPPSPTSHMLPGSLSAPIPPT